MNIYSQLYIAISPYPADRILSAFVVIFIISFSICCGFGLNIKKYQGNSKLWLLSTLQHNNFILLMIDLIQPYNPDWRTTFEKLKNILETELKGFDINIQHVGSTSIPGLYAKPVLDIDIIIKDKTLLNEIAATLEKAGYINKGEQGIAGRFAFRQASSFTPATAMKQTWQSHHLYVCFADSLALKNHLLFRDSLLQDKALIERYSVLKMALLNEKSITREEYTKRKTEFILSVLMGLGLTTSELNEIANANE